VDEWGTWFDVEPGTNPGFLFQQNTMRDAFVAALTLNIFNKYSGRIQMANIAQVVNVLQSMILTKDDKMVLTPTYHVFEMYKVHQDAVLLPLDIQSDVKNVNEKDMPLVTASASQKDGLIHISLTNADLGAERLVNIDASNLKITRITGRILTSKSIQDHNTFEKPNVVAPVAFTDFKLKDGKLAVKLPAKSIVVLEMK